MIFVFLAAVWVVFWVLSIVAGANDTDADRDIFDNGG